LIVAGAGMAGLCAAARARELGLEPIVLEKGTRPGGSMLLSNGVVWRYRSLDAFRRECPAGDLRLQQLILGRLDASLGWLESVGAPVLAKRTQNPRTCGWRFDPQGLTEALARAAGARRLHQPLEDLRERPIVLATGGFPVRLARERGLPARSNPWSDGGGLRFARARGAAVSGGMDEFYGRAMPAPPARWGENGFVSLAQLYGHFAQVFDEQGADVRVDSDDWSENRLVQEIARRGGRAWFVVGAENLGRRTPHGTIAEVIERARAAGATVEVRDDRAVGVHVIAAVTQTIGGLVVDERARVLDEAAAPIDGLYAAGVDAGGWSTGGYASGLAAALVLGLAAAEEIAR
jgi:fumarate reductase flavoprotein subunit